MKVMDGSKVVVSFTSKEVMKALGEYAQKQGAPIPAKGIASLEFSQDENEAAVLTVKPKD